MENKLRIHFVLINEKKSIDKYSKFLYYSLQLYLETDIFLYECKPGLQIGAQDLYNSWFTDIMYKRGRHDVIIVKHQEKDAGRKLSELFDQRLHTFHALCNHFITAIDLNTKHNIGDEFYFVLMARQMMPSIWGDFHHMRFGNLECQRFLDLEHKPDNPGMNFDEEF